MLLFTSTKRFIPSVLFSFSGVYTFLVGPFQGAGLMALPIGLFAIGTGLVFIIPEIIYYKMPASNLWSKWDKTNSATKQKERLERALSGNVVPVKISARSKCAMFIGSEGKYRVTLTKCTCPDFKKRHVPCKHMYYLANELNLL